MVVHRPKVPTTLETESRGPQVQGQSGQHLNRERKRRARGTAQLQVWPNLHQGLGLVSSLPTELTSIFKMNTLTNESHKTSLESLLALS